MSDYQIYTILFEQLDRARNAEGPDGRAETDRMMQENERIRVLREVAEAASDPEDAVTFTRG